MGLRAGIGEEIAGRGRQRIVAGLLHQPDDVEEDRSLDNLPAFYLVKLGKAQHRDLSGCGNVEPGLVEQTHQMAHATGPDLPFVRGVIMAGEEDIAPPLPLRKGMP